MRRLWACNAHMDIQCMKRECMYACTDYDLLIMYKCVNFCEMNIHSFIMACRLFSAKLLPKPMLTSWHLGPPGAKPWWDLNQNTILFMHLKIHVYLKNMGHFVQLSKCCPLKCWNWYIPSKPWLLMPWIFVLPGHQHPCYWLQDKQVLAFHGEGFQLPASFSVLRNDEKGKKIPRINSISPVFTRCGLKMPYRDIHMVQHWHL